METKSRLHPRNRHNKSYDFKALIVQTPELGQYVAENKYGVETINFFNPTAVKLLNASLLKNAYGIEFWNIPEGYLCPPIPGRADYLHHLADIIGTEPRKRVLDIGTGASCIYPIIGVCEYDWQFVGSDIDQKSIKTSKAIVKANPQLNGKIELRLQENKKHIFRGIVGDDKFDACMCNPPFHASKEEAGKANLRKLRNLKGKHTKTTIHSFGGQNNELWCEGGELKFIRSMIAESVQFKNNVKWFTCLVSKQGNLGDIYKSLKKVKPAEIKTIEMGQGNKTSRFVAWRFSSV